MPIASYVSKTVVYREAGSYDSGEKSKNHYKDFQKKHAGKPRSKCGGHYSDCADNDVVYDSVYDCGYNGRYVSTADVPAGWHDQPWIFEKSDDRAKRAAGNRSDDSGIWRTAVSWYRKRRTVSQSTGGIVLYGTRIFKKELLRTGAWKCSEGRYERNCLRYEDFKLSGNIAADRD